MKKLTERLRKLIEEEQYVAADSAQVAQPKNQAELDKRKEQLGIDDDDTLLATPPHATKHEIKPSALEVDDTLYRRVGGNVEFYRVSKAGKPGQEMEVQPWKSKKEGDAFVPVYKLANENPIAGKKLIVLPDIKVNNPYDAAIFQPDKDAPHGFYWDGKPVKP